MIDPSSFSSSSYKYKSLSLHDGEIELEEGGESNRNMSNYNSYQGSNGATTKSPEKNKPNHLNILYLVALVPAITLITTYIITSVDPNPEADLAAIPFVSDTLDYTPASNIGTLGLGTTVILITYLFFFKYKHSCYKLKSFLRETNQIDKRPHLVRLNISNLAFGFLCSFCLLGVVSFQVHLQPDVHQIFAVIFFISALIHMIGQVVFDKKIQTISKKLYIFRVIVVVFSFIFIVIFQATNYTDGDVFYNVSAITEILAVVTFFAYFVSYCVEWSSCTVIIRIVDSESKDKPSSP